MGTVSARRVVGVVGVGLCLLGTACGRTLTEPVKMCRVGSQTVGDTTVVVVTFARLVPCAQVSDGE